MNSRSAGFGQAVLWATALLVAALLLEDGDRKAPMLLLFTGLATASFLTTLPGRCSRSASDRRVRCSIRKAP